MKNKYKMATTVAAVSIALAASASAATLNLNGEVNTAADWSDSSLPAPGTPGTINNDGTYTGHGTWTVGTAITHTAGTLTTSGNNEFLNLNYTLSGGTIVGDTGFRASSNSVFTMTGGLVTGTVIDSKNSSVFNMSGGNVTLNSNGQFISSSSGLMSLTGGSIDATAGNGAMRFNTSTLLGGTAVIDANRLFFNTGGLNIATDWTGSLTTAKLDNTVATYALWEGIFTSGEATLNGVTLDAGGFAANFDYTGTTLTLVAVPEPSSTALLGLAGLALILRRRK